MKTIPNDEILDEFIGKKGTAEREAFDNELRADVLAYKFKELRKKKRLTQKQLAEKAGMGKEQISKIENAKFNLTLSSINKISIALGAKLNFDLQPLE
ncbi:MAG: helix-turn-helix transcriptional regulator [Flavobacteriaceae bacterium]|nr:helix-turn-helix transcriptional regulator [Flavobacteriaceae bacterium]MCY4267147.1 helix-turn-helix transcriptional regulator [Flavobacteriaceae bacterium]MCY4297926.1 helix-turn-helix transcriptional regulator [Flavobacteriaceae bacterium]